jgi:tRNA uridine 5-carbamoylmethylation protein Kti12
VSAKIILFRGLPAVGKSFISNETAKILKIAIIRKADIYNCIHSEISLHENRNKICNDIIYKIIETNLSSDTDLIIDCPFKDHEELKKLSSFIRERNGELKSILCNCSDHDVWEERFNESRINPQPDQLILDFKKLKENYPKLELEKFNEELVVDTKVSLDENILHIINYIS